MAILPHVTGLQIKPFGKINQVRENSPRHQAMVTQIPFMPAARREVCCSAKSFATMLVATQQNLLSKLGGIVFKVSECAIVLCVVDALISNFFEIKTGLMLTTNTPQNAAISCCKPAKAPSQLPVHQHVIRQSAMAAAYAPHGLQQMRLTAENT